MSNILNRQQTFATNGVVTAAGLHNLIDSALVNSAIIKNQVEVTSIGTADLLLIAPDSIDASLAPRKVSVQNLIDDSLSVGVFTTASFTGTITAGSVVAPLNGNVTGNLTGNVTGNVSGNISSTLSTFGTTNSTAASITNGTIQTLTASTATITSGTYGGLINSSTGTYSGAINSTLGTVATFNSTNGTIATLNSTTGTITNISTTLAGDFTISQGTGTIGAAKVTPAKLSQPLTSGAQVASTSGTAIDFTGIPSWAKKVTVMLSGVKRSTTSPIEIRIGISSGIEATGYKAAVGWAGSAGATVVSTTGFPCHATTGAAAADLLHGSMIISTLGSNTWVEQCGFYQEGATSNVQNSGGGSKTLAGVLDRVRITTVNGTDTFGSGTINIIYEG